MLKVLALTQVKNRYSLVSCLEINTQKLPTCLNGSQNMLKTSCNPVLVAEYIKALVLAGTFWPSGRYLALGEDLQKNKTIAECVIMWPE